MLFLCRHAIMVLDSGKCGEFSLNWFCFFNNGNLWQGGVHLLTPTSYRHTRLAGLKRSKFKELILEHIRKNGKGKIEEFRDVFPELSNSTIKNLLKDLKEVKQIKYTGPRKGGYWIIDEK